MAPRKLSPAPTVLTGSTGNPGAYYACRRVTSRPPCWPKVSATASAVTVTEPWTAYMSSEFGLAFPVDEYEKSSSENASRILAGVSKLARKANGRMRHPPREGSVSG